METDLQKTNMCNNLQIFKLRLEFFDELTNPLFNAVNSRLLGQILLTNFHHIYAVANYRLLRVRIMIQYEKK